MKEIVKTTENLPVKTSCFFDTERFEAAQRIAKMLATATMIPEHFRNNLGNCLIALNLAERFNADPFMVFQNVYIVHGKPGLEAKLVIALVNQCGKFTPLEYDFERDSNGKAMSCTAYATHRETGKVLEQTVTWEMVKAEGWHSKKGSKWLTMPELMFQYRSAAFFARVYCPEVILGMQTVDEIFDFTDMRRGAGGAYTAEPSTADDLTEAIKEKGFKPMEETAPVVEEKEEKPPTAINCPYCSANIKTVIVNMLESGGKTFTCSACKKEGKIEDGLPVGIYPVDQTASNSEEVFKEEFITPDFRSEWVRLQQPGFSTYFHKNREKFEFAPIEVKEEARVKWLKLYPETPWPLVSEVDPDEDLLDEVATFSPAVQQEASDLLGFGDLGRCLNGPEIKEMIDKCKELSELSPEGQDLNAVNKEINKYPMKAVDQAQGNLQLPTNRVLNLDESNLLLLECQKLTGGYR